MTPMEGLRRLYDELADKSSLTAVTTVRQWLDSDYSERTASLISQGYSTHQSLSLHRIGVLIDELEAQGYRRSD